jgi:hypothetical protein
MILMSAARLAWSGSSAVAMIAGEGGPDHRCLHLSHHRSLGLGIASRREHCHLSLLPQPDREQDDNESVLKAVR